MFEGSKTPLNIYVEIWILQILMCKNLNFWYQQTVYALRALKDPYFLELQQKNVVAGENCPYMKMASNTKLKQSNQIYQIKPTKKNPTK